MPNFISCFEFFSFGQPNDEKSRIEKKTSLPAKCRKNVGVGVGSNSIRETAALPAVLSKMKNDWGQEVQ